MTLLKGRKIVFKAFESGIFSKPKESKKSEQSSDDVKYNSFDYDTSITQKIRKYLIVKYFK